MVRSAACVARGLPPVASRLGLGGAVRASEADLVGSAVCLERNRAAWEVLAVGSAVVASKLASLQVRW